MPKVKLNRSGPTGPRLVLLASKKTEEKSRKNKTKTKKTVGVLSNDPREASNLRIPRGS